MDEERLLLSTIADLAQRVESKDRYELLRASGLIRQLMVDAKPLIHAANRKHRVKLLFEVTALWDEYWEQVVAAGLVPNWRWHDVCPLGSRSRREVNFDGFLGAKCLACRDRRFSVRDVIVFCANIKGGVHIGNPDAIQLHLVALDNSMRVQGIEASIHCIGGIGRALLDGVAPLIVAIRGNEKNPGGGN